MDKTVLEGLFDKLYTNLVELFKPKAPEKETPESTDLSSNPLFVEKQKELDGIKAQLAEVEKEKREKELTTLKEKYSLAGNYLPTQEEAAITLLSGPQADVFQKFLDLNKVVDFDAAHKVGDFQETDKIKVSEEELKAIRIGLR